MSFYRLIHDDEQWALGTPTLPGAKFGEPMDVYDIWAFGRCEYAFDKVPLPVPFVILRQSRIVDFNPTIFGGAIVVSKHCAAVLRATLDEGIAEFLPADVQDAKGDWEVLNLLDCVDCLDHEKSKIRYNDEKHPRHPNKPYSVERLIIDPARAAGHDLFRLRDWMVAVIASQRIKDAFEENNITGVEFWPVY